MAAAHRPARAWRERARLFLDTLRANPTGRLALRLFVGIIGGLVVLLGLVLVPLPGPGWLIVLLGLGILAIEFAWAQHLLAFTRDRLRAWTGWIGRQPLPVRIIIGLLGLLFVAAVAYLTLRYSFGGGFLGDFWHRLASY